jgi:hypothetical protein
VTYHDKASLEIKERDEDSNLDDDIYRDAEDHPVILHTEIICGRLKESENEIYQSEQPGSVKLSDEKCA